MAFLTAEQILAADDIKVEAVEVPEWGGTVRVRGLNGKERDDYEAKIIERKGKKVITNLKNARALLVAMTAIDESGNRIFKESQVETLGLKSASALNRVYDVAAQLSGFTEEDMDELTKN